MSTPQPLPPLGEITLFRQAAQTLRTPTIRPIEQFAQDEIIVPDGPRAGLRFSGDTHPVIRLLWRELDSQRWRRVFVTGPNQDGKSLGGFVIPTIHTLFERNETVICGVPSIDLVADKWNVDFRPVIEASRYRDLMPKRGGGSKEGQSLLIEFRNGARLRFMIAGGSDQTRSGFASRNLVVTETEGFDRVGGNSREGDKLSQLERRLLAFGDQGRMLAECTVTTEDGRTWHEYKNGTQSRIAIPCPHCQAFVTPERQHLVGWQDAASETEAIEKAHLVCPSCGAIWSNQQRLEANRRGVLVHQGQQVDSQGQVTGPPPQTNTLGFRWTVINSAINPSRLGEVAGQEWRAKRAADEEIAERELCQSQWVLPGKPVTLDVTQLEAMALMRRTRPVPRGVCPEGTKCVTVGVDVQKRLLYWSALAWTDHATPHVIDYDRAEVPADLMADHDALLSALRTLKDDLCEGWKCGGGGGGVELLMRPTFIFVDAGNWQDTILSFTESEGAPFYATKGFGIGQRREGRYKRDTGAEVIWSKEGYSLVRLPDGRHYLEVAVDRWKSWLHARLSTALGKPGALTLFESNDHLAFCKHLTAEKQTEEFDPAVGTVVKWRALHRNNHWLDSTTLACVAGHQAGMRLIDPVEPPPENQATPDQSQDESTDGHERERWRIKI